MRKLKLMCGKTRTNKLKNDCIKEVFKVASIKDKEIENRVMWFEYTK